MTREEAFKEINETQDYYINELINLMNNPDHRHFKTISFTSPTGTGKTKMMSKLINKLSDKYYFIITTLSKGQLNYQITKNLKKDCNENTFKVYGTCDYKINSKLQAEEIISNIPEDKECIWLRDEGHIKTNRFDELLINKCYKVINFSATNQTTDIKCNFTNTMMLRTVSQNCGTPEDAIKCLLKVKKEHKKVKNYNPCAIFRCIDSKTLLENIIKLCEENNLKYINITEENFDMSDLCEDNNEYDVIINKFKIVEGIDIRRAHVLYMDNKPSNNATTIQVIGRCRRNALLYRNDIDILDEKNTKLLENTRVCYVFYNVANMNIDKDENGELEYAFCDTISVEALKPNSIIEVKKGLLSNGLKIIELQGETGTFKVEVDKETGFNVVNPEGDFYKELIKTPELYLLEANYNNKLGFFYDRPSICSVASININEIKSKLSLQDTITEKEFNYATGEYFYKIIKCDPYYDLNEKEEYTKTIIINNNLLPILKEEIIKYIKKLESIDIIKKDNDDNIYYCINDYKLISNNDLKNSLFLLIPNCNANKTYNITKEDIIFLVNSWFKNIEYNKNSNINIPNIEQVSNIIYNNFIKDGLIFIKKYYYNKIKLDYECIFSYAQKSKNEIKKFKYTHNIINTYTTSDNKKIIYLNQLNNIYKSYNKIINDRESSIIGTDLMRNCDNKWIEDRAVTSKVKKYCKFNSFIEKKYEKQLIKIKDRLFNGKNNFNFDKKCNACLGYCVEYYSKYLVYGESYLSNFIGKACDESKLDKIEINNNIIVRACMLKYKELMKHTFGQNIDKLINTISIDKLITENYKEFVKTVVKLGTSAAEFVKNNLYKNKQALNNIDPNLSINHITALADYITEDTILDIKVTNKLTREMAKQVLAYHYLSTKRSDLNIKRVIVYDVVSGKSIDIKL